MTRRVELTELSSNNDGLHFLRGELFTGEAVETLADGSLLSLTTYVNGVEEGPHRIWRHDGTLEFTCELHDGNPVGLTRAWRHDGTLEEEHQFDTAGDLVWSRRWDEQGSLIEGTTSRSA